ncbi:YqhA family protein [Desulfurobacterium sp.]
MSNENRKVIEKIFEKGLWYSRFLVILAVIPSIFASFSLFIVGTNKIMKVFLKTMSSFMVYDKSFYKYAIANIITAVDIYLIATVMIIFSLGLYELYISKIDSAVNSESMKLLNIKSLDDLKGKLAKVVLMVLIVTFFKYALNIVYKTPLGLLTLAVSIFAVSGALYLSHKY